MAQQQQQKKPARFIRVNGRVVPIFSKEKARTAAIVGGVATGVGYAAVKYPPVTKALKFGFQVLNKAPMGLKVASAGAALGAASTVKLQNEKGEPFKFQLSNGAKDTIKRAALVSAGLGVAYYAGHRGGTAHVKGAQAFQAARDVLKGTKGLPLFEAAGMGAAEDLKHAATNLFKTRAALLAAGTAAGGTLIAKGLEKEKKDKKKTDFHLVSKVVGYGAAAGTAAGFYKGLNPGLKGLKHLHLAIEKAFSIHKYYKP